jgi:nucleoid DNA-binding protein
MAKKKTTRKKAATRTAARPATRKTTTRTASSAAAAADKPRTKTQIFAEIADETGLTRRNIAEVFESLNSLIKKDIGRRGPGIFTIPGLMKVKKIHKPRRAARKGINPFTGEEAMFKAKPAHNVVKVTPLKKLKEMV